MNNPLKTFIESLAILFASTAKSLFKLYVIIDVFPYTLLFIINLSLNTIAKSLTFFACNLYNFLPLLSFSSITEPVHARSYFSGTKIFTEKLLVSL